MVAYGFNTKVMATVSTLLLFFLHVLLPHRLISCISVDHRKKGRREKKTSSSFTELLTSENLTNYLMLAAGIFRESNKGFCGYRRLSHFVRIFKWLEYFSCAYSFCCCNFLSMCRRVRVFIKYIRSCLNLSMNLEGTLTKNNDSS